MKIKITPHPGTPGFGGLNIFALEEDGWTRDLVVDAEPIPGASRIKATWGEGMSRSLRPGEYVVVEESEPTNE